MTIKLGDAHRAGDDRKLDTAMVLRFTRLNNFEMGEKKIPIDHETDAFLYLQLVKLDERLDSITAEQLEILRCYGLLRTQYVLTTNAVYLDALFSGRDSELLQRQISLDEQEKELEKKSKGKISVGDKLTWRQRLRGIA